MDKAEFDEVVSAVDEVMGKRLTEVYGAIEAMRTEFQTTVTVLDGNDAALLGELRKIQHAVPAEVLTIAGASWERYIRGEAAHLGLNIMAPKTGYSLDSSASRITASTPPANQ